MGSTRSSEHVPELLEREPPYERAVANDWEREDEHEDQGDADGGGERLANPERGKVEGLVDRLVRGGSSPLGRTG
jgi:hypothetical protein